MLCSFGLTQLLINNLSIAQVNVPTMLMTAYKIISFYQHEAVTDCSQKKILAFSKKCHNILV